jgi:hypothetical protein
MVLVAAIECGFGTVQPILQALAIVRSSLKGVEQQMPHFCRI